MIGAMSWKAPDWVGVDENVLHLAHIEKLRFRWME